MGIYSGQWINLKYFDSTLPVTVTLKTGDSCHDINTYSLMEAVFNPTVLIMAKTLSAIGLKKMISSSFLERYVMGGGHFLSVTYLCCVSVPVNFSREYGEMALGILEICWEDNSLLAYSMLSKRHEDYNDKTIIEIAYDAHYIHFLAHPCCQKWLTKTFFGNLQVKDLNWGLFRLPHWFKVSIASGMIQYWMPGKWVSNGFMDAKNDLLIGL